MAEERDRARKERKEGRGGREATKIPCHITQKEQRKRFTSLLLLLLLAGLSSVPTLVYSFYDLAAPAPSPLPPAMPRPTAPPPLFRRSSCGYFFINTLQSFRILLPAACCPLSLPLPLCCYNASACHHISPFWRCPLSATSAIIGFLNNCGQNNNTK